jgi:filamentous hemagglutinin family protein
MLHRVKIGIRKNWLGILGGLAVTSVELGAIPRTQAQLIPDNTLGNESSIVTPQGVRDLIEGGAIRGSNLFHSFSEFNIGNNQQVYFDNPSGITDILTRITGNNVSNIQGTLGVAGTANLFLINPNGILFSSNSRLDISGSFVASTSAGIRLGQEGIFSATQPQTSTLLAIQPGVLFADAQRQHQAAIQNQGNLTVGTGQRLTLQGDTVTNIGSLTAAGGTIELLGERISLLNNGSINVSSPTGGGNVFINSKDLIEMDSESTINAGALNNGNGGQVIIKSTGLTRFEGNITARGGANGGNGGFVEVSGGNLQFSGTVDTSAPQGQVGTLFIDPKDILIQAGTAISGLAISQALFLNDVILQADNDITIDDDIFGINANNLTLLAGRSLTIAPNRTILLNGGSFTAKFNDENALIPTDRDPGIAQLIMSPASQILTNGGNVTIVSGTFGQTSQINTANAGIITSNAAGNSGDITLFALGEVTTGLLDTRSATGNGGNVSVTSAAGAIATTDNVLADSLFQAGDISLTAAAGNISLTADTINSNGNISSNGAVPGKVTLTTGGSLSARGVVVINSVLGAGLGAGTPNGVTVFAGSINLENSAIGILSAGTGQGGNVLIQAADEVVLRNSQIGTATSSSGNAGDLTLNTRRLTVIKEPGATIPFIAPFIGIGTIGLAGSSGNGGDLTINAPESIEVIGDKPGSFIFDSTQLVQTLFQSDTGISTSALGTGNSGNLTINTGRLVVRDGAGITTYPAVGVGGDVQIQAQEILLQGQAGVGTATLGFGDAGDLTINAGNVIVSDGAGIGTGTFGPGNAGNFTLFVDSLSIRNGARIDAATASPGNGGTLTIQAKDFIEVAGVLAIGNARSGITTNSYLPESGNAGSLSITTDRLILRDGGEVATATVGQGQGGAVAINARTLQLDNGRINASTLGTGDGGDVTIRTSESVDITGTGFNVLQQQIIAPALEANLRPDSFNQGIVTITAGQGAAGNVSIETPNFIADKGGLIATTTLGQGVGGNITINTSNTLELDDSLIATGTFTNAPSGNVTLNARQLTARGGAQVLTTTFGSGDAGDLTVNVSDSIELVDPINTGAVLTTGLFATSTQTASGNGGDVNINIPNGELNIRNGATVSVSAAGEGNAGNINIDAGSIFLDESSISATSTSGEGGDINLRVADVILLRNGSEISTRAGTQPSDRGNGGNMDINAGFVVAVPVENSDIIADAFAGRGGNINVTAQGILGLQVNNTKQRIPESEISASSQLGIDGTITLNTPDVDLSRGLIELPSNFSDPSNRIVAACPADKGNTFVVTGRGGIPDNPNQYLQERPIWQDNRDLSEFNRSAPSNTNSSSSKKPPLVEAQGWRIDEQGTVILTAQPDTGNSPNSWVPAPDCGDISQQHTTSNSLFVP